jgi:acyl carrier protein
MDRHTLARTVIEVVRERAPGFAGDWSLETPLGPEGAGIDSVGCLEIILELEARTSIAIRDESLTAESLATIGSLVEYLAAAGQHTHG